MLAFAAAVGVVALTNPPSPHLWAWVLLIVCILISALAVTEGLAKILVHASSGIRRVPWKPILLVVLVVTLTGGVWWVSRPLLAKADVLLFGCPHPVEVRVMTAPELLTTYQGLASRFERFDATQKAGCRTAELHVFAPPVAKARDGLIAAWSAEYLRDQGPRPDVWLPESRFQVDEVRVREAATGFGPDMAGGASIATTPIVLGVPASVGIRQNDPAWQGQTWTTLIRGLRDKGLGLIRPSPAVSTVGDFSTVAIYTSENKGVNLRQDPSYARTVEQWVRQTFTANSYPTDADVSALLQKEKDGKQQPIVLSEQQLARFNAAIHGDGPGCGTPNGPPTCLLAFYPTDTHRLDLPVVQLTWQEDPATEEQHAAATRFGEWLTGPDGRKALVAAGLRPPGMSVAAPLVEANGVIPGGPQLNVPRDNPPVAVHDEVQAILKKVTQPSQVLITVDASGSMNAPVGGGSRFTAAVDAVRTYVTSQRDTSLMVFSAKVGIHRVDLPGLQETKPLGNTPLYRAIVAGAQEVGPGGVLAVLTDGTNNVDEVSLDQVTRSGVRVVVLAFGEASCATQALVDVTSRTGGSCRQGGVDTLRTDLAELLRGV
ncbi:extracellular solute-binding protein [Actinocrispum wychmicini]|uniref:Extracellular solute-binding protein n=1 Tax=Actinocrispum wychmicini TaxID=1213861 RepID=A0A4R2JHP6_9PSEU|nr:extracellular solute-binding protein [Actinocrispum wychmicini]